jgi:hypothetical protein
MGDTDEHRPPTDLPTTAIHRSAFASHKEGPTMIDRERILATDHQANLLAEAKLRRLAAEAASRRTRLGVSPIAQARIAFGRWLIDTGRRLDADADPCGPGVPHTA